MNAVEIFKAYQEATLQMYIQYGTPRFTRVCAERNKLEERLLRILREYDAQNDNYPRPGGPAVTIGGK